MNFQEFTQIKQIIRTLLQVRECSDYFHVVGMTGFTNLRLRLSMLSMIFQLAFAQTRQIASQFERF